MTSPRAARMEAGADGRFPDRGRQRVKKISVNQRGYSLVMAVTIITLLSMAGLMVLHQAATDVQLAGAERAAQSSLYIAEAGIVWATQMMTTMLYPPGTPVGSNADLSALRALPPLSLNDPICAENSCVTPPCPSPLSCTNWYLLTPQTGTPYAEGQYRAAATCNPNCTVAVPKSYSVRALGGSTNGAQRLIEVMLGP